MATQEMIETRGAWPTGELRKGWTPEQFDMASHVWVLGNPEIAALQEVLKRVRADGADVQTVTREQLYHPVLAEFFLPVSHRLRHGQGMVFVKNVPVTGHDLDDIRIMYRAIGSYFGEAVSQNWKGEKMGHVQAVGGAAQGRVYATSGALRQHSDRIDILSLLSIRKAKQGGESTFGSALLIWDRIAEERPDLLPYLQRGFPQFRNGEQADGEPPITPYRVPIFGEKDGLRSCLCSGNSNKEYIEKFGGITLDEKEAEALRLFGRLNSDTSMQIRLQLEPGEAVFMNNYEVTHGRTQFDDDGGEDGRLLLRLWLEGAPARPRPAEQTVTVNRSGHQGIDPRDTPPGQ